MFEPHEGVDGRPRGAFAPDIDRYRALRVRHECLRDVNRDRRAQGRTVVALRAFAHLQDHQCCERGPDRLSIAGLSLILGGAAGNVFDRIVAGQVTDFLDFYIGNYHWYTFNLADAAIVAGAGFLILHVLLAE